MSGISHVLLALLSVAAPSDTMCFKDACHISDYGVALIKHFEGFRAFPYNDVAGNSTIGYGHMIIKGEHFAPPLFPDQADKLLREDIVAGEYPVQRYTTIGLLAHQADSLFSLVYNIGGGTFKKSSVLKYVNAGTNEKVPDAIRLYNRAGGRVVAGLTARREAEAELFAEGY